MMMPIQALKHGFFWLEISEHVKVVCVCVCVCIKSYSTCCCVFVCVVGDFLFCDMYFLGCK